MNQIDAMDQPAAAPPLAPFMAANTRALRGLGLKGQHVTATLQEGALLLGGDEGGELRIPLADIERIRIGYTEEAKRRVYEARIWIADTGKDLRLATYNNSWHAYSPMMRALTAQLAAQGRLARVEGGYSKFDALFVPAMMAMLTLAMIGVSIFALKNEPWWGRLIPPVIPLALFALFLKTGLTRSWPRPLTDPAELEGQLPPDAQTLDTMNDKLWMLVGGRRRR